MLLSELSSVKRGITLILLRVSVCQESVLAASQTGRFSPFFLHIILAAEKLSLLVILVGRFLTVRDLIRLEFLQFFLSPTDISFYLLYFIVVVLLRLQVLIS